MEGRAKRISVLIFLFAVFILLAVLIGSWIYSTFTTNVGFSKRTTTSVLQCSEFSFGVENVAYDAEQQHLHFVIRNNLGATINAIVIEAVTEERQSDAAQKSAMQTSAAQNAAAENSVAQNATALMQQVNLSGLVQQTFQEVDVEFKNSEQQIQENQSQKGKIAQVLIYPVGCRENNAKRFLVQ